MNLSFDPARDLKISRIIRAPRAAVWSAWTTPSSFEQWWVPAPAKAKVETMELVPGGSLVTLISENDGAFAPHVAGCYLAIDAMERLVFTDTLLGGWRPAPQPFMTAVITFKDHPDGTDYVAQAMHRSEDDRRMHEELGFFEGWGTVAEQLAGLVERKA